MENYTVHELIKKVRLERKKMQLLEGGRRQHKHRKNGLMKVRERAAMLRPFEQLTRAASRDDLLTELRRLPDHVSSWRTEYLLELHEMLQLLVSHYDTVLAARATTSNNQQQMDEDLPSCTSRSGTWQLQSSSGLRNTGRMEANALLEMTRLVELFADILLDCNSSVFGSLLALPRVMEALFYMQKSNVRRSCLASCELLEQLACRCCIHSGVGQLSLHSILSNLVQGMHHSNNNFTKAASCQTLSNMMRRKDSLDVFPLHETVGVLPGLVGLLMGTPQRGLLLCHGKQSVEVLLRLAVFLALTVVCDDRYTWNSAGVLYCEPMQLLLSNSMVQMIGNCEAYQEEQQLQQQHHRQSESGSNSCHCGVTLLEVSWCLAKASYRRVQAEYLLLNVPNITGIALQALQHTISNRKAMGVSTALLRLLTNFFYYAPAAARKVCEREGLQLLQCVARGSVLLPLHADLLQVTVNFCNPHRHRGSLTNAECVLQSGYFQGEFLMSLAASKILLLEDNHSSQQAEGFAVY